MSMADTLSPPAGGEPPVPPGRRLSEARQAQNLAAADIARQLKLSVWQVDALEAGRYQQLPGPVFVRGFIRNYARLVKLDPDALLKAAGDSLPQPAARPELPPSHDIPFPAAQASPWTRYAAAAAAVVSALALYEFVWNEPGERAARSVAATPVVPTPKAQSRVAPVAAQAAVEAPRAGPAIVAIAAVETVPEAPAAQPEPATAPALAPGRKLMRLDFDQESWVEIRDRDERVIFSQLNPPGTSQQLSGRPPFSIVVGNAHGVRMTYGDEPVDLAQHTKIDVARFILE